MSEIKITQSANSIPPSDNIVSGEIPCMACGTTVNVNPLEPSRCRYCGAEYILSANDINAAVTQTKQPHIFSHWPNIYKPYGKE